MANLASLKSMFAAEFSIIFKIFAKQPKIFEITKFFEIIFQVISTAGKTAQ